MFRMSLPPNVNSFLRENLHCQGLDNENKHTILLATGAHGRRTVRVQISGGSRVFGHEMGHNMGV